MRNFVLLISVLFLGISSCKKDEIETSNIGQPEFYFQGIIGQEDVKLEAGKKEYYLSTDNINGDTLFPAQFRSKLGKLNSWASTGDIEVLIRNRSNLGATSDDFIQTLDSSDFSYYYGQFQEAAAFRFNPEYSSSVSTVTWNFGDGGTSNNLNPRHYYQTNGEQSFNVCLRVSYQNGCSDEICSDIFLPNNLCSTQIQYSIDSLIPNEVIYSALVSGVNPVQYTWTFNDTVVVYTAEAKYSFASSTNSVQHVKLRTYDAAACETNTAVKHLIGNSTECYSNFKATYSNNIVLISPGYSEIIVNYIDANGKFYSSQYEQQPSQSNFEVTGHEAYSTNESANNFEAVDFRLNCRLYAQDGAFIDVQNATARMAFLLP